MRVPSFQARCRLLLLGWLTSLTLLCCLANQPQLPALGSAEQDAEMVPAGKTSAQLQCLSRLGIDRWHAAGQRGRGLKVAVLDSGFRNYREQLGKSLPARVTAKTFRLDGNFEARDSQHGVLCAEVVHALAPEAELLLANWEPDRPDQFLAAVRWAREQGARVLTCSVIAPSWSDGEGNGPIHAELARILKEGDLLFFACAGNTAQRHWYGPFADNGQGLHAWQADETQNTVTPWGEDRVSVELSSPDGSEYELSLRDPDSGAEVARSSKGETAGATVIRFHPTDRRSYPLSARLVRGAGGPFHLVSLGSTLGCASVRSSIAFPGDGPEVITIGAVDEEGQRQGYSACGPNSRQPKPDLVAPVPWSPVCRAKPFGGTSAAAPQAAALAAVYWAKHASLKAERIRTDLRGAARDLGAAGHDWETGFGQVALPMAGVP